MKNLSGFNKLVFFLNIIVTIVCILGYVIPFLAPKLFPLLSVFTLFLPLLLIVNILFFGYWLIQLKRQMLLSGIVFFLGITFVNKFYKFSEKQSMFANEDVTVMSYNVRLFNLYKWIPSDTIDIAISRFIKKENPDILCLQEFSTNNKADFRVYKHKYIFIEGENTKLGQAIFSKYPIVNKGVLHFPNSTNNAIFADVKRGKDTLRVYSIHLQSIKITPDVHEIDQDPQNITQNQSKRIFKRISTSFAKQQEQAEIIASHRATTQYPTLVCGDMNNSAFSYVYRKVKGNLQDAFEESGKSFGATYSFKYYPARIDYIFADRDFEIKKFETFSTITYSDHYPIKATLYLEK